MSGVIRCLDCGTKLANDWAPCLCRGDERITLTIKTTAPVPDRVSEEDEPSDSGAPQSEWDWNATHADPDWP